MKKRLADNDTELGDLKKQLADNGTELGDLKKQLADSDAKHENERAMQSMIADFISILWFRLAFEYNQQPHIKGKKEIRYLGDLDAPSIWAFGVTFGFTLDEWYEIFDFRGNRSSHSSILKHIHQAAKEQAQTKAVLLPAALASQVANLAIAYIQNNPDLLSAVFKAIDLLQK